MGSISLTATGLATAALLAIGLVGTTGAQQPPTAAASSQGAVTLEWLGHMFFRLTSASGVVVLTSPWLGNPDVPITLDDLERADVLLVPNSHSDDMGNPIEIAAKTGARVLAPSRLGRWLVGEGLDESLLLSAGVGDRRDIQGVRIRVARNDHGNTLRDGSDGGPAVSYIVTFENDFTVYFGASSPPHADMAVYGSVYKPHIALLNLRDPVEFAHGARLLSTDNPNLRAVVPTHIRADVSSARAIAQAAAEMEQLGVPARLFTPVVGDVYRY